MRITGPGQIRRLHGKSATRKNGKSAGFKLAGEAAAQAATGQRGPMPIARLDSLVELQSRASGGGRKRRAIERGEDVLDMLEGLKLDILGGTVSRPRLERLATLVERKREQADDPHLAGILDEIELRAQVELAKHRRS